MLSGCLGPHTDYQDDGTRPVFFWESGPANELRVHRNDEKEAEVEATWEVLCPAETPCLESPLALGVAPAEAQEPVPFVGELPAGVYEVRTRTIGPDGVRRTYSDGFEVSEDIFLEEPDEASTETVPIHLVLLQVAGIDP